MKRWIFALLVGVSTLTLNTAQAALFTNDTTIVAGDTSYDGQPVTISNCTLTIAGNHTFASLLVNAGSTCRLHGGSTLDLTGSLTVRTNGIVEVLATNRIAQVEGEWAGIGSTIIAGNVVVDAGGRISADGQGYACPSGGTGTGPGGGGVGNGSGGGGYGGRGGRTRYLGAGGSVYGSSVFPVDLGSSAGGTFYRSGDGGGAIRLEVSGRLTLDGTISANGADGTGSDSGGGAGGSVLVLADTLTGSGAFTAHGGDGATDKGAGGGGRIAVYYVNLDGFAGAAETTTLPGTGFEDGDTGTAAFFQVADLDDVATDPTRHLQVCTLFRYDVEDSEISLSRITVGAMGVTNARLEIAGGSTVTVTDLLIVTNTSTLLCEARDREVQVSNVWAGAGVTISATNVTIAADSRLSADGQGYQCPASGTGTGPGGGYVGNGSGGGGHGGQGGRTRYLGDGGSTYGSPPLPTDLGSSAGGNWKTSGTSGDGGGSIRLHVPGLLQLDGTVSANGGDGAIAETGGGSGGSLLVTVHELRGGGRFAADGGDAFTDKGGGGGGRIAVYLEDDSGFDNPENSTANGGTGFEDGHTGTLAFLEVTDLSDFTAVPVEIRVHHLYELPEATTSTCQRLVLMTNGLMRIGAGARLDVADTVNVGRDATLELGGDSLLQATTLALSSNSTVIIQSRAYDAPVEGVWVGRGSAIHAGTMTIPAGAHVSADGQGYNPGQGPATAGYGTDYAGGGGHGGTGGGSLGGGTYGSFRQPDELGSGGYGSAGTAGRGGGAIRLCVTNTLVLDGIISADANDGAYLIGGGAGGSIWIDAGTITGTGVIRADGGEGAQAANSGGGGRIAVYSDDITGFPGITNCTALAGIVNGGGQNGTAGFFDASGTRLQIIHHFIFDPSTTPAFDELTCLADSMVLLGGDAMLTVTNTLTVETNAVIEMQGINRTALVDDEWRGRGATLYAQDLTLVEGATIHADGQGYVSGSGPGAGAYASDYSGGGGYGGYGGGTGGGGTYGFPDIPTDLGSGGWGKAGGGAMRLIVPGTFTLDGTISADGEPGAYLAGGGAGGSIVIDAGVCAGTGAVSARGGDVAQAAHAGGGGRIAVYYLNSMTLPETNLVVAGGSDAADGSLRFFDEPAFYWIAPDEDVLHDTADIAWTGAGVDPLDVRVKITASSGATTLSLANDQPTTGATPWDTTTLADGNYTLKAVYATQADAYQGEAVRDILIINSATWHSGTISANETWKNDAVHIIEGDLVIAAGVTVTIEPGTVVKLMQNAHITVADSGILNATGTNDAFVVFTSFADDAAGGDTNLDEDRSLPQPGHWTGVTVEGGAQFNLNEGTELRYVLMSHSGTLGADETWSGTYAHRIADDVIVPSGVTLTIEPGAIMKFDDLKRIRVQAGGSLIAAGTRARPIYFTSLKDDSIGGDLNGDGADTIPGAGDWWGIYGEGGTIRLEHAVVAYGGGHESGTPSEACAIRCYTGGDVTVSNCLITEAFYDGILGWDGGNLQVVNTVVRNCDRGINVHGYNVYGDIVNCTLVNNRIGLWIWNGYLDMDNTVISHSHEAGVHISSYPTQDDMHYCNVWSPSGVNFYNMTDPTGTNGMISEDPDFKDVSGGNYRLRYGSSCIDAGNTPATTATDKMGAPRYDDPRTENTGVPDGQGAVADIGAYEFVEGAESDLDLIVTDVRGPATVTAGAEAEITWTVRNIGSARVEGSWYDRIRLTPASPGRWATPLIAGEALVTASLGPNQTATFSTTVRVPGGTEGDWRWEVRANADGAIFEGIHWNNNTRMAKAMSTLLIPAIAEGSQIDDLYLGEGIPVWYKVNLSATKEVVAVVDSGMATGRCRLYAGYGDMPTGEHFDTRSMEWNSPDVRLALVAGDEPVTAYLMLMPESFGEADHAYSLSVADAAFDLDHLGLNQAGNAGTITIPLHGSRFANGLTAALRPAAGGDIASDSVLVVDGTTAMATFDLNGATLGTYDVVVAKDGLERSIEDAFQIFTGTGGRLETRVVMPEAVRAGRVFTGYVEYRNVGDADLPSPLLTIQGVGGDVNLWMAGDVNSSNSSFNVLATAQDSPLPSVLIPGVTYSVAFNAFETIESEIVVNVSAVMTTDPLLVEYDVIEAAMLPAFPCSLWSSIWTEVVYRGGWTRGEYVTMLGAAAERAKGFGLDLMTEWDLLTFVIWEVREDIKPASVSGALYRESTDNPIARCLVTLAATNQYTSTLATNDIYRAQTWYDGRFGFVDIPAGTYTLSAKGYLPLQLLTIDLPDPAGSPVTGLSVIVESRAGAIHGYASDGSGGPPVSELTVTAMNALTRRTFIAQTDEYGYYMIHSLEPGTYSLTINAPGWLPEAPREVVLDSGDSALESFALSRTGASIGGTVQASDGSVVNNAIVRLSFLDAARDAWAGASTWTDNSGAYSFAALPPGRYALAASAAGYGTSVRQTVRLSGYDDARIVDIDLVDGVSLTGTVVSAAGYTPIADAVVSVNAYPSPPPAATTDASGVFTFEDLPVGTYDLFAIASGYDMVRTSATIPGGPVTLALPELGGIHGTIRRGTDIIAGLDVTVVSQSQGLDWTETTDSYGKYAVDNLHTGEYVVAIGPSSGLSLARTNVTLSATQSTVVCDFDLDVSVVSGTVYAPGGATPMSNAFVSLVYQDEVIAQRAAGSDGTYEFLVYTPGVFCVMAAGGGGLAAPLTNVVVGTNTVLSGQNLTAGGNSVACTVTAGGGMPIENAIVRLLSLSDPSSNALYLARQTEADGSCVFEGVADGPYRMRVSAEGRALVERDINLPGDSMQSFALETGRILKGCVTTSGGAPAQNILISVGSANLGEVAHAITDADGCYSFDSLPRAELDVAASSLGSVEATVADIDTRFLAVQTLNLQVGEPTETEISGSISNHLGTPVIGMYVALVNDAGTAVATGISDHLGQYRLTGWPGGTFTLQATASGYVPEQTSIVVTAGADVTNMALMVTGPVAEWSPNPIIQPAGMALARMGGVTDWAPDFLTPGFWRDVFSGDYGLPPPSYYNNQLGGDRLVDRWRSYFYGLPTETHAYCYKVEAAGKKCSAADDKVFETYAKFTEDWDILKEVNQANVAIVTSQNALIAARLVKLSATISKFRSDWLSRNRIQSFAPQTIESVNSYIETVFNLIGLARTAYSQGNLSDLGSIVTSMDETVKFIQKLTGDHLAYGGYSCISEPITIINDILTLIKDYENLDNDARQRFQQYTDDVNAYVDAIKNLHAAYHELKHAVALCNNPEEESTIDDVPPPPDNEGEGGDDGDGGPTDGPPWDPNEGGWNPAPTPGGVPPSPGPTGGGDGSSSGGSDVLGSHDPNDKLTVGFGSDGYIGPDTMLHYTIRFENTTNATLPAFQVTVTDMLSTNLDWSTFEFEDVRFNNVTVAVPPGLQNYYNDAVTVPSDSNPVKILADMNPDTGEVSWLMESIDPVTGGLPEDPLAGFLPPNTNAPAGEGFVKFAIQPRTDAFDSLMITNTADIVFDYNEVIPTPVVTNIIDSTAPTSTVQPLAATSPRDFTVRWTGSDGSGAGIVSYDVYVERQGAAPELWLASTTNSQAEFNGEPGVLYAFHSVARDGVGLTESPPAYPDTETITELWILDITPSIGTSNHVVLSWESATGMTYSVLNYPDLELIPEVTTSGVPSVPPVNVYTTTVDNAAIRFYDIMVDEP